jgi:hypothetical protein
VIGLQGTGEAGIAKVLQRDGAGQVYPPCPSTAREIARQFVEGKSFPCELAEAKDELPQPEPLSDVQLQQMAAADRTQGLPCDLDAELASAHRQRAQNAARQERERERESLLRGAEPPPSDPVLDPGLAALGALRERLLASLLGIEGLPESPLDNLIDRLGGAAKVSAVRVRCSVVRPARGRGQGEGLSHCADAHSPVGDAAKVAEMTGRAGRMVRTARRGGGFCYAKRENDDEQLGRLNVAEKNAFMRGDKVGLCCNCSWSASRRSCAGASSWRSSDYTATHSHLRKLVAII